MSGTLTTSHFTKVEIFIIIYGMFQKHPNSVVTF